MAQSVENVRMKTEPVPRPATLGARLRFVWFILWGVLMTIVFAGIQITTHLFRPTGQNFRRWASAWGRSLLMSIGVKVQLESATPLDPNQPYVFVSNHQNMLDIPALAIALKHGFGFVAKAELAKVPFLGWAIRSSPSVFIDRSEPRRSLESIKLAGRRIREGNSVLLFPEGGRTYSPELDTFKKGAFVLAVEAGVPLVPLTILDGYRVCDERRAVAWPGTIHLVAGEPIPMEGLRRRDIPGLMADVHAQMEMALGTSHEHLSP